MPDDNGDLCVFCSRSFVNILQHLRIFHEIEDIEDYQCRIDLMEKEDKKRQEFAKYVEDLNSKLKNNEITIEQYRDLKYKWWVK